MKEKLGPDISVTKLGSINCFGLAPLSEISVTKLGSINCFGRAPLLDVVEISNAVAVTIVVLFEGRGELESSDPWQYTTPVWLTWILGVQPMV